MLKVDPVTANDAGNYTCKASNVFGTDAYVSEVLVKQTPRFIIEPEDLFVNEKMDLKLECKASGSPLPSISWFKHAKPNRYVTSGSTLELFNIQPLSAGFYECVADNGVDKPLTKVFRISIHGNNIYIS